MFTRKKASENSDPNGHDTGSKKGVADVPGKGMQASKMKKPAGGQTRRAAFGDITNQAKKEQGLENDKKKTFGPLNAKGNANMPCIKSSKPQTKKKVEIIKVTESWASMSETSSSCLDYSSSSCISDQISSQEFSFSSCESASADLTSGLSADRVEEDISFITVEDRDIEVGSASKKSEDETKESLLSVDQENYSDVLNVGIYAQHIFDYYKRREKMFLIPAYMSGNQCRITPLMRAILVDWMVEIQENFELNHETLYLAIKLTDIYLSRVPADKEVLQLVGAVSAFIASKFDERSPPLIDDFIYICDYAFDRDQFIAMEMEVLRTVDFDLGIPISYRFLRRYAKVARMSMETLTLARYILEMSLMEYGLVVERDSMIAAAALYIAQKMRNEGVWEGDVVTSSGYMVEDIKGLVTILNTMLHTPPSPQLSTIRSKYSHEIFHEVAKIAPLPTDDLLGS